MNVVPYKRYVRRGDAYEVVVQSIYSEGRKTWVRYSRIGCGRSTVVGKTAFVRRFKNKSVLVCNEGQMVL